MSSQKTSRRLPGMAKMALFLFPSFALLFLFLAVPLAELVEASFHTSEMGVILDGWTLSNYQSIFSRAIYWEIYAKTLGAAALITFLCAVLGYPVAAHLNRASQKVRPLLFYLIAAPLLVNTVVRTYGWLLLLDRNGVVNTVLLQLGLLDSPARLSGNYIGLIIGSTQVFLPFMILSIATSLQSIDGRLLESAEILGASPVKRFFSIDLPLAAPGVLSGSVLVFSLMLGAFVTPLMLGSTAIRYLSVSIYTDALVVFNLPRAIALSMVLLVLAASVYALQARLTRNLMRNR
ncbi:ABC transporter permease [Pusillimonas caeni]|uniref:ABC transporter permease n=1 Tax=Pusillimonas caeni TaxID=1348472 RepID=UPI000E59A4AA|nr:ABC transporter permease [Pusillimonas caeni]TFL15567.1 ABC transporter permease [Pusillimonas caeni]